MKNDHQPRSDVYKFNLRLLQASFVAYFALVEVVGTRYTVLFCTHSRYLFECTWYQLKLDQVVNITANTGK